MRLQSKIFLTVILLAILLSLFIAPISSNLREFLQVKKLDAMSEHYLNNTLKKTSISFIAARGVNALVSVIQSIETGGSAEPFGIGVSGSFSPGEVLDPLNDMVERFSWVMLASSISIGIQMFLMNILPWICFKYLLPLGLFLLLIVTWTNRTIESFFYRTAIKIILTALLMRFFIPIMAFSNDQIYGYALSDKYQTASAFIKAQNTVVETKEEKSYWDKISDFNNTMKELKEKAARYFEHLIDLIIVFVVQTIVLPLITLWLFVKLMKYILNRTEPFQIETYFNHKISNSYTNALSKKNKAPITA